MQQPANLIERGTNENHAKCAIANGTIVVTGTVVPINRTITGTIVHVTIMHVNHT